MDDELAVTGALNPFSPGAGRPPKELVGRTQELDAMRTIILRTAAGYTNRGLIFSGLRGVGKTVLLHRMMQMAKQAGLMTFRLEPSGSYDHDVAALTKDMERSIRRYRRAHFQQRAKDVVERVQSLNIQTPLAGAEITLHAPTPTDSALELEIAVEDLSEILAEEHSGLFLFLDEFQEMDTRLMGTLIGLQHRLGQDMLPFYIIGTGLPNLPGVLTASRSYAERLFEYHEIGGLSDATVARCLQETVEQSGQRFTEEALNRLVLDAQGYPYYLQAYGEAAFNETTSNPIPLDAVLAGEPQALRILDNGLYDSRWQRSTQLGRQYMHAMASLNTDTCDTAAIADALHRKAHDLTSVRKNLIELGLIYAPERGKVAFTIPGMADYIQRTNPADTLPYDAKNGVSH
ncbi:AAA ATPase domain-containing protein [Bifidobacterium pseudolongum subsp. globosum]|uniref:AAA ATPase domain-containing protein n=1 Tax=Bifidobacterium pseudolongum subsp. globosum TaxID=1690 RepID=A0A4Q5A1I2_9BIFI|nr:ATP-binding protein [Bifidobacterium pseudolongum]RYQ10158.1 AAA ATPase domain-containing protein [Bifidobacterium pseudolongum subsp. globosum]